MSLSPRSRRYHRGFRRILVGLVGLWLVTTLLLALGGAALAAPPWSDASSDFWTRTYGVTEAQVATVAAGYSDGTFRPDQVITRAEFAKMAVSGLGIATMNPASPTFIDVQPGSTFYIYVEGAYAAGLINGTDTSAGKAFNLDTDVSRQQTNSILGRYLSKNELEATGRITGRTGGEEGPGQYSSLDAWYTVEGGWLLPSFKDHAHVAAVHAPGTAYLVLRLIIRGSNGKLDPGANLSRAQAAAMVVRVKASTFTPQPPYVDGLDFHSGPTAGGNTIIIWGAYLAGATAVTFGDTPATSFTVESDGKITAVVPAQAEGTVAVTVTGPRGTSDGTLFPGSANSYTYTTALPTVTFVNVQSGPVAGGDSVIIGGEHLTGATAVSFGGTPATSFQVGDENHIYAVAPSHAAGSVDVRVTTPNGASVQSSSDVYTYTN